MADLVRILLCSRESVENQQKKEYHAKVFLPDWLNVLGPHSQARADK